MDFPESKDPAPESAVRILQASGFRICQQKLLLCWIPDLRRWILDLPRLRALHAWARAQVDGAAAGPRPAPVLVAPCRKPLTADDSPLVAAVPLLLPQVSQCRLSAVLWCDTAVDLWCSQGLCCWRMFLNSDPQAVLRSSTGGGHIYLKDSNHRNPGHRCSRVQPAPSTAQHSRRLTPALRTSST